MDNLKTAVEALRPCPFCGEKAEFERMGTGRQSCIVACTYCGARHESSDEGEHSGTSWNLRAALRQLEGEGQAGYTRHQMICAYIQGSSEAKNHSDGSEMTECAEKYVSTLLEPTTVSEPWELLAELHTVAVMNDGGLPGEQMRKLKAMLEAYPQPQTVSREALIVGRHYWLSKPDGSEKCLCHFYINPDFGDGTQTGFGFNVSDGGAWIPLWDIPVSTVFIDFQLHAPQPASPIPTVEEISPNGWTGFFDKTGAKIMVGDEVRYGRTIRGKKVYFEAKVVWDNGFIISPNKTVINAHSVLPCHKDMEVLTARLKGATE